MLGACGALLAPRTWAAERSSGMKVNSISGITCHVEDLSRAAEFYETIGFRRGKEEPGRATFYVNWFFVTLVAGEQAEVQTRGAGLYLYIKVDDVEDFHRAVVSKGLKPAGDPERQPSGNREFVLRDPDGYNLVFFQK
jgi:catechol 2,3-dioxygenase-like lactoylglutathione lyase family enzyme